MRKKWNVYITRMIPEAGVEQLREFCEVEINQEDRVLSREELLKNVKGRDAVLCMLTDKIDEEILQAAGEQCKIFANYAVGFNNIDIEAAAKMGIMISNTPDVLTDATADLALTLILAVSRRLVEADKFLRAGKFKEWSPTLLLGRDVTGKTLGIIGAGRIGCNLARKARAFDMKILYHNRNRNIEFEEETGARYVEKAELLKQCDFISIHVPLTPSTHHLISTDDFKLMKNTSILINTSRGPVVDEKALVEALKSGELWGAGLDVFENEPLLEEGLAELENVVIVPHIGSATIDTRGNMGFIAVKNILAAIRGEQPPTLVNKHLLDENK